MNRGKTQLIAGYVARRVNAAKYQKRARVLVVIHPQTVGQSARSGNEPVSRGPNRGGSRGQVEGPGS